MKHPPIVTDTELLNNVREALEQICTYIENNANIDEVIHCTTLFDKARRRVDILQADNRRYR